MFFIDVISKDVHNVGINFELLEYDTRPPVGWRKITCKNVLIVKIYFAGKSQWVLDGHKTSDKIAGKYSGVYVRGYNSWLIMR